jgi:UDPglucose--hexose-1-phosphate uridylyltransferase
VGGGTRAAACPFCEGNEAETPPETFALRPGGGRPDGPGWLVRAFPNKFPALSPVEGVHEVVVSTPRHVIPFWDLTDEEAARAVAVWAQRLGAVGRDPRRLWPFCFLNQGAAAGASLQHAHAQVMGLPFAPPRLAALERAFAGGTCPLCDEVAAPDPERLVAERDGLVAWCPTVPALSGAVRIAPRRHAPDWDERLDAAALGSLLREVLGRMGRAFATEAMNLWLNARRPGGGAGFHWHLELVARTAALAGMELGTGVLALSLAPEAVAARVRAAAVG